MSPCSSPRDRCTVTAAAREHRSPRSAARVGVVARHRAPGLAAAAGPARHPRAPAASSTASPARRWLVGLALVALRRARVVGVPAAAARLAGPGRDRHVRSAASSSSLAAVIGGHPLAGRPAAPPAAVRAGAQPRGHPRRRCHRTSTTAPAPTTAHDGRDRAPTTPPTARAVTDAAVRAAFAAAAPVPARPVPAPRARRARRRPVGARRRADRLGQDARRRVRDRRARSPAAARPSTRHR